MSYDIRFAVRGEPDDTMYVVFEPEYSSPTYNIGDMLRAATEWDFVQGKWYRVSEVIPLVKHGVEELTSNREKYKKYEPKNGWGDVDSAINCLTGIIEAINDRVDGWFSGWNEYSPEYLWIAW